MQEMQWKLELYFICKTFYFLYGPHLFIHFLYTLAFYSILQNFLKITNDTILYNSYVIYKGNRAKLYFFIGRELAT